MSVFGAQEGLHLKGVTKSFGTQVAVRSVDLSISDGEFFSLLGPSGCGKTTLLRMLGGFETPDEGELWYAGRRVDELPPNERQFNTVFQRYALFPHLSVRDNVAFGPRMRQVSGAEVNSRVSEALALVQMESFADRRIGTLSGGQQQRVALARALVNRPKVLLLDEPLSALDLKLRQQMQVELKSLQRRLGHTFIFVTHDQEEALSLSDRIAVMNQGRLEQVGTPQEIYEFPKTPFVAGFIGTMNAFTVEVKSVLENDTGIVVSSPLCLAKRNLTVSMNEGRPLVSVSAGQSATLMVRPEKLKCLKSAPGSEQNVIEGVLKEVLYHGPLTHFVVVAKAGTEEAFKEEKILVTQTNSMATAKKTFSPGERVYIAWSPKDGLLLAQNGETRAQIEAAQLQATGATESQLVLDSAKVLGRP